MKKISFVFLMVILTASVFTAQSKSNGGVCVWVDSEQPGTIVAGQPGGSIKPITKAAAVRIQQMATDGLRTDKSNVVINPCPQTGENIELDVVVG